MIKSLLTSVALVATVLTANAQVLWEGSYTASGWNEGAHIQENQVKVGDILEYTISDAGADNGQILVKGSSYANLLGTAKFTSKDMATGTVLVGVTQDMLDNCGGKIFLQGDGGATVTKIEVKGSYDSENVLAWGERIPGTQIFVTIPEDATHLIVRYTKNPEWAQICNSSWTDLELAKSDPINNEDGTVTIKYELTADAITVINEKKEVIVNAGGSNFISLSVEGGTPKDPNLLWEGEALIKGWEGVQSAPVSAAKLNIGDILEYTISNPGSENAQILVKASNWSNLLGTAKFTPADMATGKVLVGVTQEMLDNCGGQIFLQGDGGVTVTKVYRIEGGFDAENVLAYGNRKLGANVYVTIPEGANYINATFTQVPDWLQLCNSGWAEIAQPVNRILGEESVTYQFEATPELVAAINDKKEVVFNGGNTEFVSLSVADELVLDYDADKVKRVETIEDVILTYSEPITVAYEEMPGFGKGSELVITYTRGTSENLSIDVYALVDGTPEVQITVYYPPYGTGDVVIPLTEEQATAIRNGGLYIEGNGVVVNKILYTEGEEITGIADVTVDADSPVEYYNLQGIKISADDATNGIFIRRQGGKSMKVAR